MEAEQKSTAGDKLITFLFVLSFFSVIGASYYKYYYKANFNYRVEASCDSTVEDCAYRDCENSPDDCPPSQLSYYKSFNIKAYNFPKCEGGSCDEACANGVIECEQIECDTEEETCLKAGEVLSTEEEY